MHKEKTKATARRPYTLDRKPCLVKKRRRPCPDCHFCQGCSQDRCRLCRTSKKRVPQKLSMAEQIALYEKINKKKGARKK